MLLAFRSKTLHRAHTLNDSERNLFETQSQWRGQSLEETLPKTLFF